MSNRMRIDKLLANYGFGTRKEVKELIKSGNVEIDNKIINDPGTQLNPQIQLVKVNGNIIKYRQYVYIMMNKPQGFISATEDSRERTVLDLLPEELRIFNPAPVGRLDKDTEGLMLLTNDGQLAHRIISPKNHIPKKYYAHIKGIVTNSDILEFKKGIVLDDGYKTMSSELRILVGDDISQIEVTIFEGKFHQVKRMFAALDKGVVYLKRLSIGSLFLDEGLELGEFRELSEEELNSLLHHGENIGNINN